MALGQNSRLSRNLSKSSDNLLIAVYKPIQRIRYTHLVAEVLDQLLCLSEIVSWDAGEEMVDSLELETAVEKV